MGKKSNSEAEIFENFLESDNEKYASLKRFLAKIIHQYLKSNPDLRRVRNNERIYQKSVEIQARYFWLGSRGRRYSEMVELTEWLCDNEIVVNRNKCVSEELMQQILDMFDTLS